MDDDKSNLLRFVPGEYVSAAIQSLPDVASCTDEVRETVLDVPNLGRLRFTCRRMTARKGRARRWFWTAEKAVKVGPTDM